MWVRVRSKDEEGRERIVILLHLHIFFLFFAVDAVVDFALFEI